MKRRYIRAIVVTLIACLAASAPAATVNWADAGGSSWATGTSWSNGSEPGTADTANFTDTNAATLPGEVTSVVNVNRTIGGLTFSNTAGKFHTLDLGVHALTVSGNTNFNFNQSATTTTAVRNGTLVLSGAFANLNVARTVSGTANGTADLTGLTSLTTGLQELHVGTSTSGSANGTLLLPASNSITAQRVYVGASFASQDTRGTMRLGSGTTLLAGELHIGRDNSVGLVDVVNGATVTIGIAAQPTLLEIANQNTNTNNTYSGVLDLKNAAVNLRFDGVLVGQKNGGPGGVVGQLLGGGSGTVVIGDPAVRGNFVVANNVNGGGVQGTVDFSRLSTLSAYVNDVWVGRSVSGSATGNVSLAATSTVDAANGILVGVGGGGGSSTLTLGRTNNTLLTNQLVVGQDYSTGLVKIATGGALTLGSAGQRASLTVGVGATNTSELYSGKVDLSGAAFNGFLGNVTVGQKDLGPGSLVGTLVGGNSGSIQVGAPGDLANFYVGRQLSGGGRATGSADLGGMTGLAAYLNTLSVGTAGSGDATGTLTLPATNTISANTIVVGGNANGTLNLGTTNTILANQLTIGQDYGSGTVTIPAGGTLNLGAPGQRTHVTIASATTNTSETYTGKLDLTGAKFIGYLGNVVVGNKNPMPGGEQGTFTISTRADNFVDATAITLGGTQSTGTLNYGGGQLFAGSITKGTGTANFNWTGGQLSVGAFGAPATPFNLANTGTGTLAPGSAAVPVGTTNVYGNYTQGAAATTAIEIAGSAPGVGNDQLNVSGSATLAGTLSLKILNGFTPTTGQTFLVATYGSRTGTYAFVAPPKMPQDVAFTVDYTTPTQLNIRTVAPTAQNWVGTAPTGTFGTAANWDTATTPTTTSSLTIANTGAVAKTVTVAGSTTVHRIALQGSTAAVSLEVPQGIQLGVANQLVLGPNATLTGGGQVLGDVVVAGAAGVAASATLAPGAPTGTLGVRGLTQTSSAVLKTTLAGPAASGAFARVDVAGAAALGGALQVTLAGGYVPAPLESFPVVTFSSRTGTFQTYANLDLPGPLMLAPVYSSTDVRLVATLPGDATADGAVDFGDLVVLAQNYNTNVALSPDGGWVRGDFTYDGVVDFSDLVALAQNYNTATSGASVAGATAAFDQDVARAFASVPEPSGLCLLLMSGLARTRRARRHTFTKIRSA